MAVALEDFDAALNATTLDLLGDTITYKPYGGSPLTFRAIVDYGDNVEQLSGSEMIVGDCAVEVPKARIAEPDKRDEIVLPKRVGQTFQPKSYRLDETGMNWLILLKKKPA